MSKQIPSITGELIFDDRLIGQQNYLNCLKEEIRFINMTSGDIYLCKRNGTITVLPPVPPVNGINGLVVCYTSNGGTSNKSTTIPGHESVLLQSIKKTLANSPNNNLYWEEQISVADFREARNGVYLRNADILVTTSLIAAEQGHHPYCVQKITNDYLKVGGEFHPAGMVNVGLRIVDPTHIYGDMYGVLHGSPVLLSHVEDSEDMEPGFYITGLVNANSGTNTLREDQYFTWEKAIQGDAPVKLFPTLAKAREHISASDRRYELLKIEEDRKEREHQQQLAVAKREAEQRELKYDSDRKESAELLRRSEESRISAQRDKDEALVELKYTRDISNLQQQSELATHKTEQARSANTHRGLTDTIKTAGILISGGIALYSLLR